MDDLSPEMDVTQSQAEALARGLYAVARADGEVHEREAALIAQLFAEAVDHPSQLGTLARESQVQPAELAVALPRADLRRMFIKTALLLAHLDNVYSPAEAKLVGEFAAAMEIGKADLAELETQAKEYLLSQLSHLTNTAAVAEVAKKLGS
jgi:tellurite resistance protein